MQKLHLVVIGVAEADNKRISEVVVGTGQG
jgi:hypothetical protein